MTQIVDTQILEPSGIDLDKNSQAYQVLCRQVGKVTIQLFDILRKREPGDYSAEVSIPTIQAPPNNAAETKTASQAVPPDDG